MHTDEATQLHYLLQCRGKKGLLFGASSGRFGGAGMGHAPSTGRSRSVGATDYIQCLRKKCANFGKL